MSSSDFKQLTESTRAVFFCNGPTVQFRFVEADKAVGKTFVYTRKEAADLGERIIKAGTWKEFPVRGISTSALRSFGQRLRDYGITGC